jgi:hypothetical protein
MLTPKIQQLGTLPTAHGSWPPVAAQAAAPKRDRPRSGGNSARDRAATRRSAARV